MIEDNKNLFDKYDYKEYNISKERVTYKILIVKNNNKIIFKSDNYINSFNLNTLNNLIEIAFNDIDQAYEFINNFFNEKKVSIKNIKLNEYMKLSFKRNNEKDIEIPLIYKNNENPENIKMIYTIKDSYNYTISNNTFTIFKSHNDLLLLIYTSTINSIICYDLINSKKITEIKNCHIKSIINYRYYFDKINKNELIMSASEDNNIKIWNINNWECILNIININNNGIINSSCFYNEENNIYIITSNYYINPYKTKSEPIKIFDFKENKIKEIKDSYYDTFYIDVYYDYLLLNNYIITGNKGFLKSYDYNKNELYKTYKDNNVFYDKSFHYSFIINNNEKIIKLIESSTNGFIRIWNFHSGELLDRIKISDSWLFDVCLWNEDYLFVGSADKSVKLIELKKGSNIQSLKGHTNYVLTIKKINHPIYGVCLISQGFFNGHIIIWGFTN